MIQHEIDDEIEVEALKEALEGVSRQIQGQLRTMFWIKVRLRLALAYERIIKPLWFAYAIMGIIGVIALIFG